MTMLNPHSKHSQKVLKLRKTKNSMADIAVAASQRSIAYSSSKSALFSISSAKTSVANDAFEYDKNVKLNSLNNRTKQIRMALPRYKEAARSDSAKFQHLKATKRDLDGTNAAFGAALATDDNSAANETRSMQSSMSAQKSRISERRMRQINPFYHDNHI